MTRVEVDVDHLVQRGQHERGDGRRRSRLGDIFDGEFPDFALQGNVFREARFRRGPILHIPVGFESTVEIPAEQVPHHRLHSRRKQIDAQVRRADCIGLGRDQVTAILESRRCAGERESKQEPEQGKYSPVRGPDALRKTVRVARNPGHAEAAAQFANGEHGQQEAAERQDR